MGKMYDKIRNKTANNITPFIIRGSIVSGKVVYDTSGLEPAQAKFVDGCVKAINTQMIPEATVTPTQDTHLTMVSWINSEDFVASLMGPFRDGNTPDMVWADSKMTFDKHQSDYPQLGFTYTRDEIVEKGGEEAGMYFDHLKEGGHWPWINARAVFEKRGNQFVVVETV